MASYDWTWQTGPELDPGKLYALLSLRVAVFVVEQQCPYQELDGHDHQASTQHLRVINPFPSVAWSSIPTTAATVSAMTCCVLH